MGSRAFFGLSRPATIQASMLDRHRAGRPGVEVNDPEDMPPNRLATVGSNRGETLPCRLESTRDFREEISERRRMIINTLEMIPCLFNDPLVIDRRQSNAKIRLRPGAVNPLSNFFATSPAAQKTVTTGTTHPPIPAVRPGHGHGLRPPLSRDDCLRTRSLANSMDARPGSPAIRTQPGHLRLTDMAIKDDRPGPRPSAIDGSRPTGK